VNGVIGLNFYKLLTLATDSTAGLAASLLDAQELVCQDVRRVLQDSVLGGAQLWIGLPASTRSTRLRPGTSSFDLGASLGQGPTTVCGAGVREACAGRRSGSDDD